MQDGVSGKTKSESEEKLQELAEMGALLVTGENVPDLINHNWIPFKMGKPVIEGFYERFQHLNWTDIDGHEGPDNFTYLYEWNSEQEDWENKFSFQKSLFAIASDLKKSRTLNFCSVIEKRG